MKNTKLIYSNIIGATLIVGILLSGGQNISQTFALFHEGEEQGGTEVSMDSFNTIRDEVQLAISQLDLGNTEQAREHLDTVIQELNEMSDGDAGDNQTVGTPATQTGGAVTDNNQTGGAFDNQTGLFNPS
jgi:hypothetical protein